MGGVKGRRRGGVLIIECFVADDRRLKSWGGCSGISYKASSGAIGKFAGRVRRKDLQDLRLAAVMDVPTSFSNSLSEGKY